MLNHTGNALSVRTRFIHSKQVKESDLCVYIHNSIIVIIEILETPQNSNLERMDNPRSLKLSVYSLLMISVFKI